MNMGFDFNTVFFAEPVTDIVNGFYPVYTECIGSTHGEHNGRHHALQPEARFKLNFEILCIHGVVV